MNALIIFLLGFFVGGMFEYALILLYDLLDRKPLKISHRFTVAKKISLFSLPVWGLIAMLFIKVSYPYVNVFIFSAILGTVLEWVLGKFFLHFFNIRLWTYKYGSIGKFTSIYSLPYWGGVGLVFGMVGKYFGM